MTMEYEGFCRAIKALNDPTNSTRKEAEDVITQLRDQESDKAISFVGQMLETSIEIDDRLQCTILLKNWFRNSILHRNNPTFLWNKIADSTKAGLLSLLVKRLSVETSDVVLRNLCETASDVGQDLVANDRWSELKELIYSFISSTDIRNLKVGMHLLGEFAGVLSLELAQHPAQLLELILKSLSSSNIQIKTESILLVSRLVEERDKKLYRSLDACIPKMIEALLSIIQNLPSDCLSSLECFITMAECDTGFFRQHFRDVLMTFARLADDRELDTGIRQLAIEFILSCAEDKPKSVLKFPDIVSGVVQILMNFIVDLDVEQFNEWMQTDEERDEKNRLFDIGEEGLDRIAESLADETESIVMNFIFQYVDMFFAKGDGLHKFAALITLSQTVEYIPEEYLEEQVELAMKYILLGMKQPEKQIRFAACQALGQISLDQQPYVQERYAEDVLPALLELMQDDNQRIQIDSCSAFINFADELEATVLKPYAKSFMQILYTAFQDNKSIQVKQQAITGIAVVAGVLENEFIGYYSLVINPLVEIVQNYHDKSQRMCCGRAVECLSIIAVSIGNENSINDVEKLFSVVLPLWHQDMEPDDPVREYSNEALGRFARVLAGNFAPYLPNVVPKLLKILSEQQTEVVENGKVGENEDMTYMMIADRCIGLKTSLIETQESALDLLTTIIEVSTHNYEPFLQNTIVTVMPLVNYMLSYDVKQKALSLMADTIATARLIAEKKNDYQLLSFTIRSTAEHILKSMDESYLKAQGHDANLDYLITDASGLRQCISEAGSNVLDADSVGTFIVKIFELLEQSKARHFRLSTTVDVDEDEIHSMEESENSEHALRYTLLDVIGHIMKHHPEQFLASGTTITLNYVKSGLANHNSDEDQILALYICDDILEHLGKNGIKFWDQFLEKIVELLLSPKAKVRQAASYGVKHAAKYEEFAPFAKVFADRLVTCIQANEGNKDRSVQMAQDNAIAALGEIYRHHSNILENSSAYLTVFYMGLPLKQDEEEGQKVHKYFLELVNENHPVILGQGNQHVPKIVSIVCSIYKTDFSTSELDNSIRSIIAQLSEQMLSEITSTLTPKQRKKLARIQRDMSMNSPVA